MKIRNVYIELGENAVIPQYSSIGSSGADLYAPQDIIIKPFECKVLPLNFKIAMDQDLEIQLRQRSGLSLNTKLRLGNCLGTLDSDYKDVVGLILENTYNIANLPYQIANDINVLKDLNENYRKVKLVHYLMQQGHNLDDFITEKHIEDYIGNNYIYLDKLGNPYGTIYIKKGDKIAQMVLANYAKANFIEVPSVANIGYNRGGGYGHSGMR